MKSGHLQILLILALFLLPEIIKIFKPKNKKYKYPDEQPQKSDSGNDYAPDTTYSQAETEPSQPDLWDILTGRASYKPQQVEQLIVQEEPAEPAQLKRVEPELSMAAIIQRKQHVGVKLSPRSAARGLIMAEILGKPRSLRPIERDLPCRREYR